MTHADTDADAYFQRIVDNGGTISAADQTAITTFVTSAKANGYWDKLLDIGPLAGDNLNAALVKLKYPNAVSPTLLNSNFVEGDYGQTTGLTSDGTAPYKQLNTNVNYNTFTDSLGGMSFWVGDVYNNAPAVSFMGLGNGAVPYVNMGMGSPGYFGGNTAASLSGGGKSKYTTGFFHIIRQSPSSLKYLVNGNLMAGSSSTVATTTRSAEIALFAVNTKTSAGASTAINSFAGTSYFYSLDDGSMSDSEIEAFASDVEQLQLNLGRIVPEIFPMKYIQIIGQSLATGGGTVLSGNLAGGESVKQAYRNKTFLGGSIRNLSFPIGGEAGLAPLTERNNETIASGFANFISKSIRDQSSGDSSQDVTVANAGVGGYGYFNLKKGTHIYNLSLSTLNRAKDLSARYNEGFIVPAILSVHGETDSSSLTYQADIEQWQTDYETDIQAVTNQPEIIPMFHSQNSNFGSSPLAAYAMVAASKANPSEHVVVGPKYFLPYSDGIHLTNVGYRKLGEYYAKAYKKVVIDNDTWNPLRPVTQVLDGKNIDVTFTGNVGDLVLDTDLVSNPGNYGFEYTDDSTSAVIESVTLFDEDTVRVTLDDVPTGDNQMISYAITSTSGASGTAGPTTGARGNLRDSDPTQSLYDDDNNGELDDNLYNWAVHFSEAVSPDVAPILSSISSTPNQTEATIAWITDDESTSLINYGLTDTYTSATTFDTDLVTSHSQTITGLTPSTTYHYSVTSTDSAGNTTVSVDQTFTTLAAEVVEEEVVDTPSSSTRRSSFGGRRTTTTTSVPPVTTFTPEEIKNLTDPVELIKVIQVLRAQLEVLRAQSATPSTPSISITRDLDVGATGDDVNALQEFLIAKGFMILPTGVSKGYFGPITRTALAKYQASVGISPAVGYFGPVTRVHMSSQ